MVESIDQNQIIGLSEKLNLSDSQKQFENPLPVEVKENIEKFIRLTEKPGVVLGRDIDLGLFVEDIFTLIERSESLIDAIIEEHRKDNPDWDTFMNKIEEFNQIGLMFSKNSIQSVDDPPQTQEILVGESGKTRTRGLATSKDNHTLYQIKKIIQSQKDFLQHNTDGTSPSFLRESLRLLLQINESLAGKLIW